MATSASTPTTGADLTGGCLCGAVRYRLSSEPFDAGWCHCRMCQLNSGSPAMVFASVSSEHYAIDSGEEHIRRYRSSDKAERWFCGQCGTPLLWLELAGKAHDFSVATLDSPEAVLPTFHIWYASRIAWDEAADDLPQFSRSRHE
jgi:hypothetical protein